MNEFIEKILLNLLKHYITGDKNQICNYVKKVKITVLKFFDKSLLHSSTVCIQELVYIEIG